MSGEEIRVKMAELKITEAPGVLITVGLGSCVGVAIYDSLHKIGGLIHVMLPENRKGIKNAKYADTGIPLMINNMIDTGASKYQMRAKIAGGAQMFNVTSDNNKMGVGDRNIQAVQEVLKKEDIDIIGQEIGQNHGRTVKFYTEDGRVEVSSYKKEMVIL